MNLYYVFYDKNVYKNFDLVLSNFFLQLTGMLVIPFSCLELNIAIFVVQSLSRVQHFETPLPAAHQAHLSSTIFQRLLKFISNK